MMKMVKTVKENVKKIGFKLAQTAAYVGAGLLLAKQNVAASGIGQNAMKTITSEGQWIGWILVAGALGKCLAAKNYVAAVISGIAGSIIVVLITNPEKLKTIGDFFVNSVVK